MRGRKRDIETVLRSASNVPWYRDENGGLHMPLEGKVSGFETAPGYHSLPDFLWIERLGIPDSNYDLLGPILHWDIRRRQDNLKKGMLETLVEEHGPGEKDLQMRMPARPPTPVDYEGRALPEEDLRKVVLPDGRWAVVHKSYTPLTRDGYVITPETWAPERGVRDEHLYQPRYHFEFDTGTMRMYEAGDVLVDEWRGKDAWKMRDIMLRKKSRLSGIIGYAKSAVSALNPFSGRMKKYALTFLALTALNTGLPTRPNAIRLPVIDWGIGYTMHTADTAGWLDRTRGEWENLQAQRELIGGLLQNGFRISPHKKYQDRLDTIMEATDSTGWIPLPSVDLPAHTPSDSWKIHASHGTINERVQTHEQYSEPPETLVRVVTYQEDRGILAEQFLGMGTYTGIDYWAIGKGLAEAIRYKLTGSGNPRGGSTIPMQVARLIESGGDLSMSEGMLQRKTMEILTALNLTQTYENKEIVDMYLNLAYFGKRSSGWERASLRRFNTRDLNLSQAAVLAAYINVPSRSEDEAWEHAENLLKRMHQDSLISDSEMAQVKRPWFDSRSPAAAKPQFETAMSLAMYEMAQMSGHKSIEKVWEWRRDQPFGLDALLTINAHETNALFNATSKGRLPAHAQFSGIAVDESGAIRAAIGGNNLNDPSELNRLLVPRDYGSSLKPFVQAAFIEWTQQGNDPDFDTFAPLNLPAHRMPEEGWDERRLKELYPDVRNANDSYGVIVSMRDALKYSKNLPHHHMMRLMGPEYFAGYMQRLGVVIEDPKSLGESMALGTIGVSPYDLVGATVPLTDGGKPYTVRPYIIESINVGGIALERYADIRLADIDTLPAARDYLRKALAQTVYTTARSARVPGVDVGLKTGTNGVGPDVRSVSMVGFIEPWRNPSWRGVVLHAANDENGPLGPISAGETLGPIAGEYAGYLRDAEK